MVAVSIRAFVVTPLTAIGANTVGPNLALVLATTGLSTPSTSSIAYSSSAALDVARRSLSSAMSSLHQWSAPPWSCCSHVAFHEPPALLLYSLDMGRHALQSTVETLPQPCPPVVIFEGARGSRRCGR